MNLYKMLRKNEDGSVEVFYTDDLRVKKLYDIERKKQRHLNSMHIDESNKKIRLQQRQKVASDLRKIKIARKEVLP